MAAKLIVLWAELIHHLSYTSYAMISSSKCPMTRIDLAIPPFTGRNGEFYEITGM